MAKSEDQKLCDSIDALGAVLEFAVSGQVPSKAMSKIHDLAMEMVEVCDQTLADDPKEK